MRPRRTPRLLVRRDGEPRLRDVPRDAPAARSRAGDAERDDRRRAHDRPRDRGHVVRRPRDDEAGGTGSGSTRRSPPSWSGSASTRTARRGTTWDDFALGRSVALDTDALSNTRTVEYDVHTPEDADGMFDVLTYQKGGSVLRMLERWLGADAFRAGVRAYLDRYRLANTETTDLWDSIEEATGQPVRKIMDSWIFQPGFPLVTARRDGDRGDALATTLLVPAVGARARNDGRSRSARGSRATAGPRRVRCCSPTPTITTEVPAGARVVLDAGGEGFYRVAYPPEWRAELLASGALRAARAVLDRRRHMGRGARRASRPPTSCSASRGSCATKTTWSCGGSWSAVLRSVARVGRRRRAHALRGEIGLVLEPVGRAAGLAARGGRRRADPAAARHRARRARDAGRGPGRHRARHARRTARRASTPTSHPRASRSSRRPATPRRSTTTSPAPTPRRRPRSSCGSCTRSGRSRPRSSCCAPSTSRCRTRCGRRTVRSSSQRALRNRGHGPAAWVRVRDRWPEVRGPVLGVARAAGCSKASRGWSTTRRSPTCRASSRRTRCRRARG